MQYRLIDKQTKELIQTIEWDGVSPILDIQEKYDLELIVEEPIQYPFTEEELQLETIKRLRQNAFEMESDHLFFQYQEGTITKEEWLAKKEEIRARYPYPQ